MAIPTIQQIKENILSEKSNYEELNGLNSTSKVAMYNLWAYIIAVVAWIQYSFFELFKAETDQKIREQKRYTLLWFRNSALDFRYGHPLDDETAEYSDDGYTEEEIELSKIVNRAAVIELEVNQRKQLFIKVATEVGGDLEGLTPEQMVSLEQYFAKIKPAGTKIVLFSDKADDMRLSLNFYYDPLVLDENGARIDGTNNTPAQDAIRAYLKELKFNGEFSIAELEDRIQAVEGCSSGEAYVTSCEANFQTPTNWIVVQDTYVANSGYMSITDANLTITFIPKKDVL